MARRKASGRRVSPTQQFEIALSGSVYEACKESGWKKKPTRERKRGYGVTYYFTLNGADAKSLVELLTELACDLYDKSVDAKTQTARDLAERVGNKIYDDLGKFPEELQPR